MLVISCSAFVHKKTLAWKSRCSATCDFPNLAVLNAADFFQPKAHTLPYRHGTMTGTDGPRGMRA